MDKEDRLKKDMTHTTQYKEPSEPLKDCINPAVYWQCISLNLGKCCHPGPCEPVDQDGNRYTIVAVEEEGKTVCYIRSHEVAKILSPVVDAEAEQRKALTASQVKPRPTVTEEPVPSPHPYLDKALPARDISMAENLLFTIVTREMS